MTDQEELLSNALQTRIADLDAEVLALRKALECVLQVSRVALLQPMEPVYEIPEFLRKGGK